MYQKQAGGKMVTYKCSWQDKYEERINYNNGSKKQMVCLHRKRMDAYSHHKNI